MKIFNNEKGLNIVGQGGKIILFTLPFLLILILIHRFLPELASLPESIKYLKSVGYIFLIPGILLWATGIIQLLIEFPKSNLITNGAYSIVRNPIYSSFCFFILPAISFFTFTWAYIVVSIFMYIGVKIYIKKEEEQLKEIFGKDYEDYCLVVDRMIPFNFIKASKNDKNQITKYFLIFGVLAVIFHIASDAICALSDPSYNYLDQTVSELSAIGAPTRNLWRILTFLISPLAIAFGIGIIRISAKKVALKFTGILIILWGISLNVWPFFPMNIRGSISGATSDTVHLILAVFTVLLFIAMLVFGSFAEGKKFKIYSLITLGVMMIFGFLTGRMTSLVAENKPTPLMGVFERVSEFLPMIWMIILAIILLKKSYEKRL